MNSPKRLRRWSVLRWVAVGALTLFLVFPYVASVPPFRHWMFLALLPKINGTMRCTSATFRWMSPIRFEGIEIRDLEGAPLVKVPKLEGDRPLWRLLLHPGNLGSFRIEQPELDLVNSPQGWNLAQVFGILKEERGRPRRQPLDISLGLELVDGRVSLRTRDSRQPWRAEGINLAVALEPRANTAARRPQLAIRPGILFDQLEVTPQLCHDLLVYVAPIASGASRVSGRFTVKLDAWQLPLGAMREGAGSGQLVIHSLELGTGPVLRGVAELLGVQPVARLVDNSTVAFHLAGGRMIHRGLQFRLGQLTLRTEGSVGLADRSLEMLVEMPIPDKWLQDSRLASTLAGKTIQLPITGTLERPKLNVEALAGSNRDILAGILKEWLGAKQPDSSTLLEQVPELLERIRQRRASPPASPTEPPGQGSPVLKQLLDDVLGEKPLRERLRDRKKQQPARDASGQPDRSEGPGGNP